jgi:hypothetical protein
MASGLRRLEQTRPGYILGKERGIRKGKKKRERLKLKNR